MKFFSNINRIIKNSSLYNFARLHLKYKISNKHLKDAKKFFLNNQINFTEWFNIIDTIVSEKKSLVRFGDGEFACISGFMLNKESTLNKCSRDSRERLIEVFTSNIDNLLIGILPLPISPYGSYLNKYKLHWNEYTYYKHQRIMKDYFDFSRAYTDSTIFMKSYVLPSEQIQDYRNKISKIWEGRDVVFVSNFDSNSRLNIYHNIFNTIRKSFIINIPANNAYSTYDSILDSCLKYDKTHLFLLSGGFAAKILSLDLTKLDYQSIDIGNITMSLED